jgi:putative inorganic carbon (hco3(-)) transporter
VSLPMDPAVVFLRRPVTSRRVEADFVAGLLTAYAAMLPFEWEVTEMVRFSVADMVLIVMVLVAPFRLRYRPENWSMWHYALLALFAFSSLNAAARAGQLQRYVYLNKDIGLIVLFIAYAFLTSVITTWPRIRMVLRAFVFSVVMQNVVGLLAWVASTRFGIDSIFVGDNGLRLDGMMGDANAYGGLVVTALVISEGACAGSSPLFKTKFHLFARVTLAAGSLVCFSRTGWISLACVFAFLFLTRFATALRGLFLLLSGFAVTMSIMGRNFLSLFQALAFRPEVATGAGRTRYDLVSSGLADFSKHPFFGMGIGSFYTQQRTIVHNTGVWFLTEFGLIGLLTFAGFVAWFAFRGHSALRLAPEREKPIVFGLILGLIAMTTMSLGIEAFYQRHWWLVFALIASSYSVARRQRHPRLFYPAGVTSAGPRSAFNG